MRTVAFDLMDPETARWKGSLGEREMDQELPASAKDETGELSLGRLF